MNKSWRAVQSSALIDGEVGLHPGSAESVAAHLSMGMTEQHHRHGWSIAPFEGVATGKIACVPSSLVCTSPHPLSRSSVVQLSAVGLR